MISVRPSPLFLQQPSLTREALASMRAPRLDRFMRAMESGTMSPRVWPLRHPGVEGVEALCSTDRQGREEMLPRNVGEMKSNMVQARKDAETGSARAMSALGQQVAADLSWQNWAGLARLVQVAEEFDQHQSWADGYLDALRSVVPAYQIAVRKILEERIVVRELAQALYESPEHANVLMELNDGEWTLTEFAKHTGESRETVVALVEDLRSANLVRVYSPKELGDEVLVLASCLGMAVLAQWGRALWPRPYSEGKRGHEFLFSQTIDVRASLNKIVPSQKESASTRIALAQLARTLGKILPGRDWEVLSLATQLMNKTKNGASGYTNGSLWALMDVVLGYRFAVQNPEKLPKRGRIA